MPTPADLTLRDRLHEFFHAGDRESWRCGGDLDVCPLVNIAVIPMQHLISEWLMDQDLSLTERGTVLDRSDFDELAAEAEAGYDVVDGKLVPRRPAVIGKARRERDHSADDGHTFRLVVSSRMSSKVVGDTHHQDADHFGPPHILQIRAWDLPAALRAAAGVPLAQWDQDD